MKSLKMKMMIQLALLALATVACNAADQQLYLLTGPAAVGVAAPVVSLLRVNGPDQGPAVVRTLFDGRRSTGSLCSVGLDAQDRLISLADDEFSGAWVSVVDMDKPAESERLAVRYSATPGRAKACLDGFLARSPDGRLLQVVEITGDLDPSEAPAVGADVSGFSLVGVQLRPIQAEPALEHLSWQYRARMQASTVGWEQGISGYGLPEVNVDQSGALSVLTLGPAPMSRSVAKRILDQVGGELKGAFRLEVNDADWLVLLRAHRRRPVPGGLGISFHDVMDKSVGDWQTLEVPGSESILKNFGEWLAGTVIEGDSTLESPGKSRRTSIDGGTGRIRFPIDSEWEHLRQYSPGKLYLVNAKTHQTCTVETGDGDSEVLLIENETIYYRVDDTVFRAAISAEGVGAPTKLATDPQIPDAHWAFLGPPAPTTPAASRR